MKRSTRRMLTLALPLAALLGLAGIYLHHVLTWPRVRYTVRGVAQFDPRQPLIRSFAQDINERGEIAGDAIGRYDDYLFVERDGRLTRLHTPDMGTGFVTINDRGDVLYWNMTCMALWRDGRWIRPEAFGHRLASGSLAEDGSIVGEVVLNRSTRAVVRWRGGQATRLRSLLTVEGVDSSGAVIGRAGKHPALWRDGAITVLPPLPGFSDCVLSAMNNRGQVVGESQRVPHEYRACLWENGRVRRLGTLMEPRDINDHGQVVGCYKKRKLQIDWSAWRTPRQMLQWDDTYPPALYEKGRTIDLNDLIPPDSGWRLEEATAINDRGQIVGTGRCRGNERGFVLTPVQDQD